MTSWLYRDGRVYRGVLRLLYGDALAARERVVCALVPAGASVVDVCCGDAAIARRLGRGPPRLARAGRRAAGAGAAVTAPPVTLSRAVVAWLAGCLAAAALLVAFPPGRYDAPPLRLSGTAAIDEGYWSAPLSRRE